MRYFVPLLLYFSLAKATQRASLSIWINTLQPHPRPISFNVRFLGNNSLGDINSSLLSSAATHHVHTLFPLLPDETIQSLVITFPNSSFVQKTIVFDRKAKGATHLKTTTEDYKAILRTQVYDVIEEDTNHLTAANGCHCVKRNCACCSSFNVPALHFQHSVCVNISYNAETIGLDLSIGIDGHYYTQEISARNPPPVCLAVPGLHDVASVCVALTELDISKKHLTGCVDLEAELVHMRLIQLKLGCFNMPI